MAPWYPFGSYYGVKPMSVEEVIAGWEAKVKVGKIMKADSIKELSGKLGLDGGTLQQTVATYNGFCERGADDDFFKRPGLLVPVKKKPFYGSVVKTPILLI